MTNDKRCHAHEWVVFRTALQERLLMLRCVECGAMATVNDPTKDEWSEAFHAPSRPYKWTDEARVHFQNDPPMKETAKQQARLLFPGWMFLDESNDLFPFFYPPKGATGLVACVTEETARSFAKKHPGIRVVPVDDDVLMGACHWFFEKRNVKYLLVCEWLKGESALEVKALPLDQFLGWEGGPVVAEGQHRLNPEDFQRQRGKSMKPRNFFGS